MSKGLSQRSTENNQACNKFSVGFFLFLMLPELPVSHDPKGFAQGMIVWCSKEGLFACIYSFCCGLINLWSFHYLFPHLETTLPSPLHSISNVKTLRFHPRSWLPYFVPFSDFCFLHAFLSVFQFYPEVQHSPVPW